MTGEAFIQELQRLLKATPRRPVVANGCDNCSFSDCIFFCKNCIFCFDTANSTDATYIYDSYMVINSVDCDYVAECDSCYECVDAFKCFNSSHIAKCDNMIDSAYSYDCSNCTNVFGCVRLRNKSYCFFNRQLSRSEYEEKVRQYKELPSERILEAVEELKKRFPLTQTIGMHNENSPYGNYNYYNKNCYLCFDTAHNEDCAYLYDSFYNTGCFDMTYSSRYNEHSSEIVNSEKLNTCRYAVDSSGCQNSTYIFNAKGLKDCLGCVGLSYKQYCILNRQLDEAQYKEQSSKILQELSQINNGWAVTR